MFEAMNNQLIGSLPATLSNLTGLQEIGLQGNNLSNTIPGSITMMENLRVLDLSSNNIVGQLPAQMGMLTRLLYLSLEYNQLYGSIPAGLDNLTMIEHILLSSNMLGAAMPTSLFHLGNLVELNLSHNSLTGPMPPDISFMKVIDLIDISNNRLVGSLPSSFVPHQMLTYLDLSHNLFEGFIPQTFDHLTNLVALDLSSNNISGTIPNYLANCTYLTDLNLSFNKLEGKIPNGGVFSNLTFQSLMGNIGLCDGTHLGFSPCLDKPHQSHGQHFLKFVISAITVIVGAIVAFSYIITKRKIMEKPVVSTSNCMIDAISYRLVSYQEISRATDNFNENNLLGVGSFSKVFKGQLDDGLVVAIKVLNMQVKVAAKSFVAECQVLRMSRHRNLIRIANACSKLDFRALLLQLCPMVTWMHACTLKGGLA
jgi:hypothetical protein